MHGGKLWEQHPGVRTGGQLLLRERAADALKHWFGTWTALGAVAAFITFWWFTQNDPGHLNLNLTLSCVAAVQGIVLQIAANRGDRIGAEVAAHTRENTDKLLTLNEQQLELLKAQQWQAHLLRALADEVKPGLAERLERPDGGQPGVPGGEDSE